MISMSYTEFNTNSLVALSKFVTEFLCELTKAVRPFPRLENTAGMDYTELTGKNRLTGGITHE